MKTLFGNRDKIEANRDIVRAADLEESGAVKEYEVLVEYTVSETTSYCTDMQVTVHAQDEEEALEYAEEAVCESLSGDEEMDNVTSKVVKITAEPEEDNSDKKTINMFTPE